MKKVILIIAATIVLIVGGMFLYVSLIDWNSHKDKIASQFSNVTGKDVVFEGPVSFKVFPSTYLSAENIKIYDNNRSVNPNPLATIKNIQVDLSLFSLFGGGFDIKRMVIDEPEMIVEILPEGKINWQSPVNYDQEGGTIDVFLDSVTIQNAKLNIISKQDDLDVILDNLNAEVIGESIFGPYRIEGTYIKDNNPEGFAVSLGRFSDSFATSLNFVITHPRSSTHLRFDGSFFLKNSAVNGNVIFESGNVVDFLNSYFHYNVSKDFEYPLAVSMEVNTNKTKIDISNFVVKYGDTLGAGNVLLPLANKEYDYSDNVEKERQKIEVSFNMTEMDLTPVVKALNLAKNYYDNDKQEFSLDFGYDVLFDLKSIKTSYNDQNIRDFSVSLDILKDNIVINQIGAILPGETSFTAKGKVFALEDILTYNTDVAVNSIDALRMFQWLGYDIPTLNQFTYRGLEFTTNISGNMKNIKISPLNLKLDKTLIEGDIGVLRAERPNLLVDLSVDSVNFDNYLEQLPNSVAEKGFEEQIKYWFEKIGFLKNFDMQFDTTLGLGIYSSIPFENTNLSFKLNNGVMDINNLSISSVKNASVDFKGELSGFGEEVKFSNLKYNLSTQNFYSIFPEDKLPPLIKQVKDLKKIDLKGVITGDLKKLATKSVVKLDNIDFAYSGNISDIDGSKSYDGKVELRAPDFIKFVNRFNVKYNPRVISMGIFRLKSSIKGTYGDFVLKDMETYIGSNKFEGDIIYKKDAEKQDITAQLHINRFELDRFFYNANKGGDAQAGAVFSPQSSTQADFIAKPFFDKIKIDYMPYAKARIKGDITVDSITYKNEQINQAKFSLDITDTLIKVSNFIGNYSEAEMLGDIAVSLSGDNPVTGKIILNSKPVENFFLGTKYGFDGGQLNADVEFNSIASSEEEFYRNISGNVNFKLGNTTFVGWNIDNIEQDLLERKVIEGLPILVLENLQSGKTEFSEFTGSIILDKGKYKFVNTNLVSNKYSIAMTAEGSIDLWDITSGFVLDLNNIEDLPNVKFNFNGPLSSPSATVDVDAIGELYQQRLDAIEEEKKQKELERLDKLTFLMGEEQDKAIALEKVLVKNISFINERLALVTNTSISNEYKSILNILNNLKDNIDEVIATSDQDEETYTNKGIETAKIYNTSAEQELTGLKKRIDTAYLEDIKDLVNKKYNDLANKYKQSRIDIVKYRDKLITYPKRMAVIKKVAVVNNDKKVQELKALVEENFLKLDAQNTEASKDYVYLQAVNNVAELEGYISKIDEMMMTYEAEEQALNDSIDELFIYLEEMVLREEEEYDRYVEEELKKQKIEENIGSISTSSGKNVTVVREIEEIEKFEELQQKEEIKVLDFSKENKTSTNVPQEKKVITREEINATILNNETGGILKKTDGEISGASGSISKK